MKLIKKVKEDLKNAMIREVDITKGRKPPKKNETCYAVKEACRAIISMFPEIGIKSNNATDYDVIKLCRKYIKTEKVRLLYQNKHIGPDDVKDIKQKELDKLVAQKLKESDKKLTSPAIRHIESYLPPEITKKEVVVWIKENIDFSKLKNKMQAVGMVMKEFEGAIDGNFAKEIILKM